MTGTQEYIQACCAVGDVSTAASFALEEQKARLAAEFVPHFWAAMSASSSTPQGNVTLDETLPASLETFCTEVAQQQQELAALAQQLLLALPDGHPPAASHALASLAWRYQQAVTTHLLIAAPLSLHSLLKLYLDGKLQAFVANHPVQLPSQEDEGMDRSIDMEHEMQLEAVIGEQRLMPLDSIRASLAALGLQHLLEDAALGVACSHVQQALASHAVGDFRSSALADCVRYVELVPLLFLRAVMRPQDAGTVQRWGQHLQYFVFETVGRLRISEMFDVVVDYPDSLPAVHDLRDCLKRASLQQQFVSRFRAAIRKRLLHAGAATTDIIVQYVSTIKALREVDPSGVLLEAVADPIREYLRSRKDTIRCIVTMLTDDSAADLPGGESLFQELDRTNPSGEDVSDAEMDDDEAALAAAAAWEPDPVTADPGRSARTRRMSDIIAALVGIYGSKELFITEYRLMLADRLASKSDFDTQRERRTMELLKLRFGEANLHDAEIMLGDVAASKRINAFVHASKPDLARFRTTIVSELFWPTFQGEPVELPPQVSAALDEFSAEYQKLKAPRKLQWKPSLGSVQLVVSAGSTRRELRVAPMQAAVLLRFKEQPSWQLEELAAAMKLSLVALRKTVIFWTSQGVLRLTDQPGGGAVVERAEDMQSAPAAAAQADDEPASSVISAEEQQSAEREMFDRFLLNMLNSFDGVPPERIHNMLKMFIVEPHPYDKTEEQLAAELSRLVAAGKLAASGGVYRIERSKENQ